MKTIKNYIFEKTTDDVYSEVSHKYKDGNVPKSDVQDILKEYGLSSMINLVEDKINDDIIVTYISKGNYVTYLEDKYPNDSQGTFMCITVDSMLTQWSKRNCYIAFNNDLTAFINVKNDSLKSLVNVIKILEKKYNGKAILLGGELTNLQYRLLYRDKDGGFTAKTSKGNPGEWKFAKYITADYINNLPEE